MRKVQAHRAQSELEIAKKYGIKVSGALRVFVFSCRTRDLPGSTWGAAVPKYPPFFSGFLVLTSFLFFSFFPWAHESGHPILLPVCACTHEV
jgi:hypothetical protein